MLKGFVSGEEKDIKRVVMKVGNEYKEGWEVRDNQDRLIWGREDELQTATGTLPFKGYSLPLKVKSLLGNAVQNGTPAPDNIIIPEMCGVRTENLFLSNWEQGAIDSSGVDIPSANGVRTKNYIPVMPNTIYSISRNIDTSYINLRFYNSNKQYINYGTSQNIMLISGNSEANPMAVGMGFCCFEIIDTSIKYMRINDNSNDTSTKYMMVEGQYTASTMPAYEPYGYKISITNAGQTTPIYLGEVPTVRRIRKLVLTGEESWNRAGSSHGYFTNLPSAAKSAGASGIISTHYKASMSSADGTIRLAQGAIEVLIYDNYTSVTDFKSYLAAQYAAGTPVTAWYVLATPETAIVNEPLCKIGTYADELNDTVATLPEIPTTTGQNTLTVDTTLAPSSLTVKGHIKELA